MKINGFSVNCLAATLGTGSSDLVVKDTTIDNCSGYGINLSTNGTLTAKIINTHVEFANGGLAVNNGFISISGSTFSAPSTGNYDVGISTTNSGNPIIMVDN